MSSDFRLERQHDPEALRYRAAADRNYGFVGYARRVELLIVSVSVIMALVAANNGLLQFEAAFWGLALAIVDSTILYHIIITSRHRAAQLVDCFDRYVFSDTSSFSLPCAPSADVVATTAETHLATRGTRARLTDWYDAQIAAFPRARAHLAALRINAFWDSSLRGSYILGLSVVALTIMLIAAYLFSRNGFTLERLEINVLVPLAPAFLWFGRELVDQLDARARKREFQHCIESIWEKRACQAPGQLAKEIDYLQALLFAYRRVDVSVPNWLYWFTRDRHHRQVATLVERLVQQQELTTDDQGGAH